MGKKFCNLSWRCHCLPQNSSRFFFHKEIKKVVFFFPFDDFFFPYQKCCSFLLGGQLVGNIA
jgi:hypothetical protein